MINNFERYNKNINTFTKSEIEEVQNKSICIVGNGGLGGNVCQSLSRFGVGKLTLVDGDVFAVSNLNRQVFATEKNIGQKKAETTKEALSIINSDVSVTVYSEMLTSENAVDILAGHDLVIDCLDNIPSRFALMDGCENLGIPFVHGAIGGFYGQVTCVFPGDNTLRLLYPSEEKTERHPETDLGAPSFTPMIVAGMQSCEALKILAGRDTLLRGKFLYIDTLNHIYEIINLI